MEIQMMLQSRKRPRLLPPRQPTLSRNYKYDDDTGQVYSETTTAIQISDDRNWAYTSAVRKKDTGCQEGARSLQDVAIECLLGNLSAVTMDVIEPLPLHLVARIWQEINRRFVKVV